ncbi:unnamed protein product [Rotaria sp. Silwood2]|nr:unnamed protein product [Rotaria sp. Silwood2]CAF4035951.1 unnamed protein product [Rotaria sp. Silwood2]
MSSNLSAQWEKLVRPGILTLFYREYPLMELHDDACQRIQEFLYKILRFLLRQYPHRAELEQWLYINYPEAQYALNRSSRKRIFSIDQLQTLVHKEFGTHNEMDISYLATTLEHCTKDVLKLAHDYVNRLGKNEIVANDIDLVMNADTIFVEILRSDLNSTTNNSSSNSNIDTSIATMSYNELIRHFIITETQYKDDLENDNCKNIKNRVLDYLVRFNDADGRFDISFNPTLKSSSKSTQQVPPDLGMNEDHDEIIKQIIYSKTNTEDFHVPHLTIVMLIVGLRGDVQPFIAFSQALHAAGHHVRLATHEKFRKYVREHDLEFFPLAANPDDLMSFMVKNGDVVPSMSSIIEGDLRKHRRNISNILVSTWHACTENDDETSAPFTAEVIIANPPSFGHVHCTQKLQIPLHIMFTMPWSTTTVFPHPFCRIDYSKLPKEKFNLLSYSAMDILTWYGMRDLVNDFRRKTLDLPSIHTRQAFPRPYDWPPYIDVSGYFFLNTDNEDYKPSDDLFAFIGLNSDNQDKEKLLLPIYIGFGSITGNDSDRLVQVILDALAKTGHRALLSGFDQYNDELPDNIFKIVSAVCHHGGAGTTATGLRAGKPSIILPFFGDQFFWGDIVEKNGVGPSPIPGKSVTVDELVEAFKIVHQLAMQNTAKRIREILSHEDGCATALRMFHAHLPLSRMRSDLESTFTACYRVDELDLQVSRPVAQVLVAVGALDESQFRLHPTQR